MGPCVDIPSRNITKMRTTDRQEAAERPRWDLKIVEHSSKILLSWSNLLGAFGPVQVVFVPISIVWTTLLIVLALSLNATANHLMGRQCTVLPDRGPAIVVLHAVYSCDFDRKLSSVLR